jgi:hypothetical protein
MTDGEQVEEAKSAFRNWTKGDIKLFIITVAATVAANILTVIMVALAVILARSSRPNPPTPGNYAFFFAITLFPLLGLWGCFYGLHIARGRHTSRTIGVPDFFDKTIKWTLVIIGVVEGLISIIYILTWIGFAAGIK